MAVICDTSGVYALYDTDDAQHAAIATLIKAEPGPLFLPVILLAEIDYLLNRRLGHDAAFEFIEAVEQGDFTLVALSTRTLAAARWSPSTALWKLGWRTPRSSPPPNA